MRILLQAMWPFLKKITVRRQSSTTTKEKYEKNYPGCGSDDVPDYDWVCN